MRITIIVPGAKFRSQIQAARLLLFSMYAPPQRESHTYISRARRASMSRDLIAPPALTVLFTDSISL